MDKLKTRDIRNNLNDDGSEISGASGTNRRDSSNNTFA